MSVYETDHKSIYPHIASAPSLEDDMINKYISVKKDYRNREFPGK